MPICRDCSGHGRRYYPDSGPVKEECRTCEGSGQREPKSIITKARPNPLGDHKRSKMAQVAEHKTRFIEMVAEASGGTQYINDQPAAPCQTCQDLTAINQADFSHKKAAGMGGAGDVGGKVLASNGTYSCRCCHSFIEQDIEARDEHELCAANMENGLKVEFSAPVIERYKAWRIKWMGAWG
jgi:hypothetical protein